MELFMLCMLSVIALMCPLSYSGMCNMVLLIQTNVYSQSGPLSSSSINFWAASTRVDKWPWWRSGHTTTRLNTWSPLGTGAWCYHQEGHIPPRLLDLSPWERAVNLVCVIACTWNCVSVGQKSRDPLAALEVGSHRVASAHRYEK